MVTAVTTMMASGGIWRSLLEGAKAIMRNDGSL
jgi:hypothetical protein